MSHLLILLNSCRNEWDFTNILNNGRCYRGIGIDLRNWTKKLGNTGDPVLGEDGNPILEQVYSVETGTVLVINTEKKKLYNEKGEELVDISSSFTPQKLNLLKLVALMLCLWKNFRGLLAILWA
ncbi:MAG: hypothetical protein CM15mP109_04170 [Candidatus Dadabacteria bacterium]|nr:MAG: hypothetical protein CM15mP109_04170 [Candidatus Dadabacteria bacterium]